MRQAGPRKKSCHAADNSFSYDEIAEGDNSDGIISTISLQRDEGQQGFMAVDSFLRVLRPHVIGPRRFGGGVSYANVHVFALAQKTDAMFGGGGGHSYGIRRRPIMSIVRKEIV